MRTTSVFEKNLAAYNKHKRTSTIIANQGGQGSSKTRSILQILYLIALYSKRKMFITVGAYALPHLKGGAIKDFDEILIEEGVYPDNVKNKTDQIYYIGKSEINFIGIEGNEAKATGPRRDVLYINEANKRINYNVFELMNARTSLATFIDFNPSCEFWYHDKIKPNFSHVEIKSTFLDNSYLPDRERENILSKKDKPGFENWFRVYGLGELGRLEGSILSNWEFGEFDHSLPYGFGLDYGMKHPDAMVRAAFDKKNGLIYWKEEIYKNDLSTDKLFELIKQCDVGDKMIVAEYASGGLRTNKDFRKRGLNVIDVSKGRVVEDVKAISNYRIIIDPESYNLVRELNNWVWLDKKGEVPIDEFDDLIDAARYITMKFIGFKNTNTQRAL